MKPLYLLNIVAALCIGVQDNCAQWTILPDNAHPNVSASFSNKDTGFVATGGKMILRTTDGGSSWRSFSVTHDVHVVKALERGIVFAGGGAIFKSVNYGILWDSIYTQRQRYPIQTTYTLAFHDSLNGVIAGNAAIELTNDGGAKWSYGYVVATPEVYSSYYLNETVAYLGGLFGEHNFGVLLKTSNGGSTWTYIMSNQSMYYAPQGILSIHFFNERKGIVGGSKGGNRRSYAVLVTTDGGETWDTTKFVFPYTVKTIAFADSLRGFIGDIAGNIYSTIDGGTSWQNDNVPSNGRSVNSIAIAGGTTVYAVGDGGLILKRELVTSVTEGEEQERMSVYPNPARSTVRICVGAENIGALLTISDMFGRTMATITVRDRDTEVDLRSYPQGTYIVTTQSVRTIESRMIMVMADR